MASENGVLVRSIGWWVVSAVALGWPAMAGCGGGVRTVPVEGTVTVDGAPVEKVAVSFTPIGGQGTAGPGSSGVTDAQGRFSLRTIGDRRVTGAVPGKHRVTLSERAWPEGYDPYADPSLTPEQLAAKLAQVRFKLPLEARNGSLTFEVPPGGTSEAHFKFSSAAAKK